MIGVSRSSSKLQEAKRKRLITSGTQNLKSAARAADFLIVCTPVDTIPKIISEIDRYAKAGTIVTDVGSTKESLVRWAQKRKFKNISFVGSHPMAGSHRTGLSHARSDLYRDSFTFVTKHSGINQNAVKQVTSFWKKLCRKVFIVSAERHDKIVSEISHLPHLIAALLAACASSQNLQFASTGFRDTTRVAKSDPRLWVPILLSNRKNMLRKISQFSKFLNQIKAQLNRSDQKHLSRFLQSSSSKLS